MLYRLKDRMVEFLQPGSVDDLPTSMDDLAACRLGEFKAALRGRTFGQGRVSSEATENQVRLCVAKNKNNDWKSGFFTVEANVLFVLNLLELFVHWRLRQDEFRGCVLPEAGRDALFLR